MTTMVLFEAAGARYCLPVQATRSVRTVEGMITLPDPASEVAGIIPGDPPLTVISPFQSNGAHVLVIEANGKTFGLLVDVVTGLRRIDDHDIRPAPLGQHHALISGILDTDGNLVLVADESVLARQL
jgi:chemotaxis signal transduction protein